MDKKFKMFVIIALVFFGIAIAGSTYIIFGIVNKNSVQGVNANTVVKELAVVELGDAITANISDEYGEVHIMRVVIGFGVEGKEGSKAHKALTEQIEGKNIVVRDEIIQIIREQTYEMMDKADAKAKLGDEIIVRVNKLLNTETIKEVYYGDFFVQ